MDLKKSIIINFRWHRRIGLAIFVMLFFLALTGFALNHSPALNLSETTITNNWLQSWYGIDRPAQPQGFKLDNHWLFHDEGQQLFFNENPVSNCQPPLHSAAKTTQLILGLCNDMLVLLTKDGQLVETYTRAQGFPSNATALHVVDNDLHISISGQIMLMDIDNLTLSASKLIDVRPQQSQPLPENLSNKVFGTGISLETVILDLHSGRFFGSAGVLFVDLVGLLLCILAITGLWGWINHIRLRKL